MKRETNGLHIQYKDLGGEQSHPRLPELLCLLLLNCGGALILCAACPTISWPWWVCALLTTAIGTLLLWLYGQPFGGWIVPAGSLGLLVVCLALHKSVLEGLYALANDVQQQITARTGRILLELAPADPQKLLRGLLPLLLCWALLVSRAVWRGRPWMALPVLLPLLVGAFAQVVTAGVGLGLLLFGCILLMLAGQPSGRPWGQLVTLALAAAISIALGLLLGENMNDSGMTRLEAWVHSIRFHSEELIMPEGDLKNLPARVQSEVPALEVTMETPQKLYLRGAVYENYTGTAWKSADTQKQADYEDLFYWLHESSFYGQSQIGLVEQIEGQRAQSMTVQTLDACGGHDYYPYAVAGSEMLDAQRIGDAELPALQELHYYTGSVPRWYELQQALVESQNTTAVSGYLAVEQEYAAYVSEMDLQMTQTSWEVLRRHIDEEDSGKTLGEIREIIRTYLDGAITYDESVGTYNGNSDFLQYVLERSGSGYDVHYATAATLLLRYFGVPARYVEGYFVSADEAALIQAGEPVTLDESHAHAWAEYYLNGVGFVPFEVTPGYIDDEEFELGGTQQSEYVYDGNQLRYAQVERPEEISELQQDPFVFSLNPLLLLLLLPLLLLVLIILLILRRRKFRQAMARIDQAEDREAISLRYGYARCLLHHSSATAPDGAETAAKLNELALFSEQPMTREQRREMDGFAAAALQACKEKWTLSQKLRYKLWDCLY